MTFLASSSSIESLSDKSRDLLGKVDPYVLDYNIFLFKGIQTTWKTQNDKLFAFLSSLMKAIPQEYKGKIFNPIENNQVTMTTTAKLQLRLLELLIHERHRRDIDIINKQLGGKLNYIALKDPHKYEIKSPYYLTFKQSNDEYGAQFYKLALLQSLEYDFEHELDGEDDYQNDDDLVAEFCSETVLNFKLSDAKKQEDILDSELVKVLIPLASQVILMQDGDETEIEVKDDEE